MLDISDSPILRERLHALRIDSNTRHNMGLMRGYLVEQIDDVVSRFYSHFTSMPSARRHFDTPYLDRLKQRQRAHWLEMFECRFDERYLSNAVRIGHAHFVNKVPLRLYLAGQNYFHCLMIELAARRFGATRDLPVMLSSVARVIALDVDLATSAYTRALWRGEAAQQTANDVWL